MKLFFKDNQNGLRIVEIEEEFDLNNQNKLRAVLKAELDVTPIGAILSVA